MSIKDLPFVTVEQVVILRQAAIELEQRAEAAKQRELELLAVIEKMKAASKFVHEDLVIRAKLAEEDSLNVSQSALDGLIESIEIESSQALREHEAKVLTQATYELDDLFTAFPSEHNNIVSLCQNILRRMAEERRKK